MDFALGAMQAADAAEQIGEALQIAGFLELAAVHDRRKAHDFGVGFAMARDQRGEPLDHVLVERGPGVDAVGAHLVEQDLGEMIQRIGRLGRDLRRVGSDGSFMVGLSLFIGCCRLNRASWRHAAHQACGGDVGEDAVVVDHQRRRKHVAQMAADAEVAVVAISRQAAGAHRAHHGLDREFGRFDLEQIDRRLEVERGQCALVMLVGGIGVEVDVIMARSFVSVILAAVKCAAPGGIWPPAPRAALRMNVWARSTAAAAMPAQTDAQHRCATGVIVWA